MTKTSKLLASVLATLLVILVAGLLIRNHQISALHTSPADEYATATAQDGQMTKEEALNLERIEIVAEKQGLITEPDLAWALNLLKTPTGSRNPFAPALRRSSVTIVLRNVKNLSPDQKDRVYQAVTPLLSSSDDLDRLGAVSVMGNIKDKRALPALTHLLQDPDPKMRSFVRYTIKVINS